MKILSRGTAVGCSLQALVGITIDPTDRWLHDISSGEWMVRGPNDTLVAGPIAVDDCPAGDRIGLGMYALPWTIPPDAASGRYLATWSYLFPDGAAGTFELAFEVVEQAADPMGESYASVGDMRCEGFREQLISDEQLADRLKLASRMVERWTGQVFVPEAREISVSGKGGRILHLGEPVIAIGRIAIEFDDAFSADDEESVLDPSEVRVFARHLSQGLRRPDDRRNPKIERFIGGWPRRPQSVLLDGVFGYTEPDGSTVGATPSMIRHATMLLAARNIGRLGSGRGSRGRSAHLIVEERTIDQQEKRARPPNERAAIGMFTGDPEIDTILEEFRGPLAIA